MDEILVIEREFEIQGAKQSMTTKIKIFDTCELSVITYGCDRWSLTKHHREKLERCQRAMERKITGTKKRVKVRSCKIREKNHSNKHTYLNRPTKEDVPNK